MSDINYNDILSELEERGLIIFEEDNDSKELFGKKTDNKHLNEVEQACLILPYIIDNIAVSNRELEKLTGMSRHTIGKVRNSEMFANLLLSYTNKAMINTRTLALTELNKLLLDKNTNANTKQKLIATALSHTERILEIYGNAKKDLPQISVDDLLIELENMG